ncbi:phosphopantetheine-binding protein [Cohnella faecalis]|uniref:Acyl carrier protein n=1 Tax=Cohnella faecalis TaxID=2315694 RepID=A0A398CMI8_9BACL|nr:phosphopantetheine-binding protein [Cohnella faecalis]RIE00821.1 acyl carrier protein [Cohnella faecalis]
MTREAVLNQLTTIIHQYLEVEIPETVTEESRLFDDLSIDSIMVLQLIVYIEEEFNVTVPEEDLDPSVFFTLGSLVTFIQQLQAGSGRSTN